MRLRADRKQQASKRLHPGQGRPSSCSCNLTPFEFEGNSHRCVDGIRGMCMSQLFSVSIGPVERAATLLDLHCAQPTDSFRVLRGRIEGAAASNASHRVSQ
jgi:hypothetical protein